MLKVCTSQGKLKIPVKAYRSHVEEFIIYKTSFRKEAWEDVCANRICLIYSPMSKDLHINLQNQLHRNNYLNYILVEVIF
jgi:hypothetical protein